MRESHRPTLPRGLGSKIILPTLLVIVMFAFPVLLAWQGMLSIQSENESMRGYSQSLVDLHEVQAGLQAEAAASLNADAQNTVRTVILAMVLTGLLGLGLAVLLTRRITRPVRALTRAAQNLSKGKLGHRVEIRGKNELARLGRAFNHMASSL
ncbi:MAG: HAMP domain-containing protein, partial [Actinomycetota bacterium]